MLNCVHVNSNILYFLRYFLPDAQMGMSQGMALGGGGGALSQSGAMGKKK